MPCGNNSPAVAERAYLEIFVKVFSLLRGCILISDDEHTYFITTSNPLPKIGLNSLYCGKWRKQNQKQKSHTDLDLDWTMPNAELVQAIFIYTFIYSSYSV